MGKSDRLTAATVLAMSVALVAATAASGLDSSWKFFFSGAALATAAVFAASKPADRTASLKNFSAASVVLFTLLLFETVFSNIPSGWSLFFAVALTAIWARMASRTLDLSRPAIYSALIYALDAALFFLVVLSQLPDTYKIVGAIAVLAAGGALIAKANNWQSYFGINMIRGDYGLRQMAAFAKRNAGRVRFIADAGAGIGYGVAYSLFVFKSQKKTRRAAIVFLSLVFSAIIAIGASSPTEAFTSPKTALLFAAGVAGGVTLQSLALLAVSAINILTVPNAPAGAQLLIVGVTVPWEWIFGLVIAATIHEFSHGVLCKVEKLKVKGSGAILFGFLPLGAFVEPDEEKFKTISLEKKRRILAAGPAANLAAFVIFTVAAFAAAPLLVPAYADASAVKILSVNSSYPGSAALAAGDFILGANGNPIQGYSSLADAIGQVKPGGSISFQTQNGDKAATVGNDGKLGIMVTPSARPGYEIPFFLLGLLMTFLTSTAYLNLAIGSINLVPLFITDGGRIASEEISAAFRSRFGMRRGPALAAKFAAGASVVALLLILANLALPAALKFFS